MTIDLELVWIAPAPTAENGLTGPYSYSCLRLCSAEEQRDRRLIGKEDNDQDKKWEEDLI